MIATMVITILNEVTDNGDLLKHLNISVPPRIDPDNSSPSKVIAIEGQDAELRCQFSGEPKPEVTWFRGFPNAKGRKKECIVFIEI